MTSILVNLILGVCVNNVSLYKLNDTPMTCIDYYNNCVHNKLKSYYGDVDDTEIVRAFNKCNEQKEIL